jgi:outer membrane protein OmpA-like peptidoglycan-associated protein
MSKLSQGFVRGGVVAAMVVALSACAADDPNRRAKTGAVIGAVVGGVAGSHVGGTRGAIIGGAVGAIGGGAVGNYMDKQARELEEKLAAERARDELQITRMSDNALKIGIASDVSFDVNSADLKPGAQATYARIAAVLKDYDQTVIHIVGHTDSTGTAEHNQRLSERRAASVASYMLNAGVLGERVRQEGRGLREPIAPNDTAANRTRNRRVDIVIKPVVEGREAEAWNPPPYLGS